MQKLNGETLDIVNTNIDKLKEIFPDVFSEGKIDFEALKSNLGEFIDKENERYSFSWNGKEKVKKIALTPSTGTLRPCKDESKDWETTENLYIEGDNLEVLKLLQKSYFEKIKMIYIDPPYNTGKDFVYKDNFNDNLKNYLEVTGQVGEEGEKLSTNSDQNGRYHSNWLNMMYPRLKLARNLLKDDGVIFISIGQDELSNLEILCNEIFGEVNCLGIISRQMKSGGGSQGKYFAHNIDYILIYAKLYDVARYFKGEMSEDLVENVYNQIEVEGPRKGEYYRSMGLYQSSLGVRPGLRYFVKCPDGSFVIPKGTSFPQNVIEGEKAVPISTDGVWRWSYEKYIEEFSKGNIEFKQSNQKILINEQGEPSKWNVYTKIWLNDRQSEGTIPNDLLTKFENRHSSKELSSLNVPFDFAKPVGLIKYLVSIMQQDKDILILDFFSGSATTAHAVMKLNSEDEGNRKFIMVQLPEVTDEKSEAYKSGYKNICEIGKARIDKAGEKIKEEFLDANDKIKIGEEQKEFKTDIGFKVFKLDSSNIKAWDSEYAKNNIGQMLIDSIGNIKEDRTELDLLFELLLKQGLDLITPITQTKVNDKVIYNIGAGALYVSLSDNITVDVAEKIIEENKIYNSPRVTVIFKDNGFKNDVDKTNVLQTLKVAGISDIKSI